jgi:hypothetical protein
MWHRMDFILCHIQFSLHHTLFTFTWIPTRKHTTVTTLLSTQFVVLLSPFIATHQFGFLWQCRAHTLNEHLIYSPSLHISLSTKYSRASPPHIWIPTIHHIMLAVRVSTSLPICWRSMAQTYFEWMQLNSSSSRISRITRVSAQNSPRLCPYKVMLIWFLSFCCITYHTFCTEWHIPVTNSPRSIAHFFTLQRNISTQTHHMFVLHTIRHINFSFCIYTLVWILPALYSKHFKLMSHTFPFLEHCIPYLNTHSQTSSLYFFHTSHDS